MINRIPQTIALPAGWEACAAGFENELKRELSLNFLHPSKNVVAVSVARAGHADDVFFKLIGHKHKLALVHLTWNKQWRPSWPETTFYDSWEEWIASLTMSRNRKPCACTGRSIFCLNCCGIQCKKDCITGMLFWTEQRYRVKLRFWNRDCQFPGDEK
ncbi:MAG: hypothetical protein IT342_11930 [Candidatus Melainabacteria bacterium]|nr:hypothetical protein [Candidatus Melainabacteria bacterium]